MDGQEAVAVVIPHPFDSVTNVNESICDVDQDLQTDLLHQSAELAAWKFPDLDFPNTGRFDNTERTVLPSEPFQLCKIVTRLYFKVNKVEVVLFLSFKGRLILYQYRFIFC